MKAVQCTSNTQPTKATRPTSGGSAPQPQQNSLGFGTSWAALQRHLAQDRNQPSSTFIICPVWDRVSRFWLSCRQKRYLIKRQEIEFCRACVLQRIYLVREAGRRGYRGGNVGSKRTLLLLTSSSHRPRHEICTLNGSLKLINTL